MRRSSFPRWPRPIPVNPTPTGLYLTVAEPDALRYLYSVRKWRYHGEMTMRGTRITGGPSVLGSWTERSYICDIVYPAWYWTTPDETDPTLQLETVPLDDERLLKLYEQELMPLHVDGLPFLTIGTSGSVFWSDFDGAPAPANVSGSGTFTLTSYSVVTGITTVVSNFNRFAAPRLNLCPFAQHDGDFFLRHFGFGDQALMLEQDSWSGSLLAGSVLIDSAKYEIPVWLYSPDSTNFSYTFTVTMRLDPAEFWEYRTAGGNKPLFDQFTGERTEHWPPKDDDE